MQIEKFEGDYNKEKFYSIMGKFFAEPKYKKEMPYLANREGTVWFVAVENDQVIGFVAVNEASNIIKLSHDYVVEPHRGKGIYNTLNEKRNEYINRKNKPIEIAVKEPFLIDYWKKRGFIPSKKAGSYVYLRKETKDV